MPWLIHLNPTALRPTLALLSLSREEVLPVVTVAQSSQSLTQSPDSLPECPFSLSRSHGLPTKDSLATS